MVYKSPNESLAGAVIEYFACQYANSLAVHEKKSQKMLRNITPAVVVAAIVLGSHGSAYALMPLAKPAPFSEFDPGSSAPFAGSWEITIPTMEVGEPDTILARCALPVRIQAADQTHIFYLGPRETEADAAMQLQKQNGGAMWEPIAGGPSFFAFWVSQEVFYLYDKVPEVEADWGLPYVYHRCD